MKKLILPVVVVISLTLFSFILPTTGGVSQIGEQLYSVERETVFNMDDKQLITNKLQKAYDISDAQLKEITEGKPMSLEATAGKAILHKTWINIALVNEHFVVWEISADNSAKYSELVDRIDSYTK